MQAGDRVDDEIDLDVSLLNQPRAKRSIKPVSYAVNHALTLQFS